MATQTLDSFTAEAVRSLMHRDRVSQRDLASLLGVSQTAISRRLSGEVDFSASEVRALAERFAVLPGALIAPDSAPVVAVQRVGGGGGSSASPGAA